MPTSGESASLGLISAELEVHALWDCSTVQDKAQHKEVGGEAQLRRAILIHMKMHPVGLGTIIYK